MRPALPPVVRILATLLVLTAVAVGGAQGAAAGGATGSSATGSAAESATGGATAAPVAAERVSVPDFGPRGEVPVPIGERFMDAFRAALRVSGLDVAEGELITAGIAGSLEPEFATLIAEIDDARYAVSGEIVALPELHGGAPLLVDLIVVDALQGRASDLLSRPLAPSRVEAVARDLAAEVALFVELGAPLPEGDAALFVTSEPGDALVLVDGAPIGRTSSLDVRMLPPGRHRLELRKEGYLPDVRQIDLRSGDTSFVHVPLTSISGGSVQIDSHPPAAVIVDGRRVGRTPLVLPARPGTFEFRLARDGFRDETVAVPVRNYRVSRVELDLRPEAEPLVFWDEERTYLVSIDGVLQPGGAAAGLEPGPASLELRRGDELRRYRLDVPASGAWELDLETGGLRPWPRP